MHVRIDVELKHAIKGRALLNPARGIAERFGGIKPTERHPALPECFAYAGEIQRECDIFRDAGISNSAIGTGGRRHRQNYKSKSNQGMTDQPIARLNLVT